MVLPVALDLIQLKMCPPIEEWQNLKKNALPL